MQANIDSSSTNNAADAVAGPGGDDEMEELVGDREDEEDENGSDSIASRMKFLDEMEKRPLPVDEPSSDANYRVESADTDVSL